MEVGPFLYLSSKEYLSVYMYPSHLRMSFRLATIISMHHKIQLDTGFIHLTIQIHHHGFCSATIHLSKDLQHSYWIIIFLFHFEANTI